MPSNRVIGLDISSSAIKAAQVRFEGDTVVVEKTASRPLRPGLVKEGLIAEGTEDIVASELTDFVKQAGFQTKEVILGVNNSRSAFVRDGLIPWTRPEDLKDALPSFIKSQPSLAGIVPDEAEIDYTVIGEVGDGRSKKLRLLVYAARTEAVEMSTKIAKRAGLSVVGVDLNSLAALRVMRIAHRESNVVDVIVDVGAQVTTVIIHQNGAPRSITLTDGFGGWEATSMIASAMDIEDHMDAERFKQENTATSGEVFEIITAYNRRLVSQIVSTIDGFLRTDLTVQNQAASVTLLGGGSLIQGFQARLEAELMGIPVTWGDYASNYAPDGKRNGVMERFTAERGDIAVAVGLASGARL